MLFLAQNSALDTVIGVTGVAVIVLFSLVLGIGTLWMISETDNDEPELFTGVFVIWIFGTAIILFITTTLQRIL